MIYGNNIGSYTGGYTSKLDDEVRHEFAEHTTLLEDGFQIVIEAEQNWNTIMRAVAFEELGGVLEGADLEAIDEASSTGFFASVKAFFKNLWEKIKGLFAKFFAMLNSWTKSDSEFVSKYNKEIFNGYTKMPKTVSMKGYIFVDTTDDVCKNVLVNSPAKGTMGTVNKFLNQLGNKDWPGVEEKIKELKDDLDDVLEAERGDVVGSISKGTSGRYTAIEFAKELTSAYRNGETSKVSLDESDLRKYYDASTITTTLKGAAEAKKTANKNYKTVKKQIDDAIKSIEDMEKTLLRITDKEANMQGAVELLDRKEAGARTLGISYAGYLNSLMKGRADILTKTNAIQLTALKDHNRMCKAVAVKYIGWSHGVGIKKESGSYMSEGSLLSGINLI